MLPKWFNGPKEMLATILCDDCIYIYAKKSNCGILIKMGRNKIKYKFAKDRAILALQKLQFLENKRYLDKIGLVKTVRKVIITPYNEILLAQFLKEPNLFVEYKMILDKYPVVEYAILIFLESSNLHIQNFTIEEFEFEFGLPSYIMEMVVDLSDGIK